MDRFHREALEVIRQTKEISFAHWGFAEVIDQKDHSAHNVVTEVDRKIETALAEGLSKLDGSIEFVGEEFGGNRNASRFWLADPIDGTAHFVRGMPFCTTMVALVENGEVTFSAIYDFVRDEMFFAIQKEGAYKNEERISVSTRSVNNAYAGYESRMEKKENVEKYLAASKFFLPIRTISSGYEHILAASGKIEARICFDPYGFDYDFAPGTLLIREAGGVVANIGSDAYDYRNVNYIAANPILYKALTEGPDAPFPINR